MYQESRSQLASIIRTEIQDQEIFHLQCHLIPIHNQNIIDQILYQLKINPNSTSLLFISFTHYISDQVH